MVVPRMEGFDLYGRTGPGFRFRSATVHQQYDVTPDDQRFVMIRNRGVEELRELIVVENFFEELKAKVGN